MTDSLTRTKKKNKKKSQLNWKKVLVSLIIVFIIICLGMGCFFAWSVYKETEDFSAERLLSGEASKIYDANGELMYTYGSDENGKRENVTYEELPQVLIDAVVSAEDSRFFEHDGFDLPRIAKTFITNLASLRITGGGSTITQQVIKQSYFPDAERTYTRKLSEVILAIQATKEISKEEIITLYLNKIYFGRSTSSIGVAAASKYYFNKDVSQLTLPEAALLAGTLNSPSRYDPYYNLEAATSRRNVVLNLMVQHGYITQEECDLAKQVKVENMLSQSSTTSDSSLAAYVDLVTEEVIEKTGMNPAETQMNIYTYCNQDLQRMATQMANGETYDYTDEDLQMAGSVQSTQDGRIVAVIGGRNYKSGDLNKATVKQQPGSSMKPILDYGLAYKYLDWCTGHTVEDKETTFNSHGSNSWTPKNWDGSFHGSMTISEALVNSWNIPAISTFEQVLDSGGEDAVIEDMKSLGIDMSYEEENGIQLPYAIGGWAKGVSPVELAGAYATVANNGIYIESHTINYVEIVDKNETVNVDQDIQDNATQSLGEDVSFMIRETMLSYSSSGSGSYAYLSGIDNVGAKTGTSNTESGASKDLWMTAYTPDYTCSVWMGFESQALKEGKNTSRYRAYPGKVVGDLLEYLEDNTTEKKSYPDQPDSVEQIQIVAGVYPYQSPSSSTPASSVVTCWAKKGKGPTSTAAEATINNLNSFEATLNSSGTINVSFGAYDTSSGTTYGTVVYVVEVYDESNQLVHTETLSNNTGTINYKPTGNVRVVGYYKYAELEVTSNKVERTINVNTSQLDDVNYTITSNGSTVSNGSTISGTSIAINVHAQNESNTITIQFLSSTGESILDPITFTGSATREFTLDSGFTYTVRVTESNGTNSVNRSTTFTVSG
ncbi:penicillin-binding protein [Erysipelatoclostridium sp. An15]|uniref:transglycosylase domain-containing protein n=1 Tax=Erysipelatoclostridium sp. An15 TaxID=1965566 RepID=UPI000B373739|nr:transglycosylase domain-containing protein [Erysipelatoclostridium sp. An15]OUQ07423.1 penicillin-binding protein [Erysipelatoclostridium sp. An15]